VLYPVKTAAAQVAVFVLKVRRFWMTKNHFFKLVLSLFMLILQDAVSAQEFLNKPLKLVSGEEITLGQYEDKKPVYLKFWATWCKPCREQMPHFESIEMRYGKDIEVIGVNLGVYDDLPAVQTAIKQFGLTMKTVVDVDGELAQALGLRGTPYHLLFDKQMKLIHTGNEADETLNNKIKLLSEKKVVDSIDTKLASDGPATPAINLNDGKTHALFFTSTWCDWYLADSKPEISQQCAVAPKHVNELAKQYPDVVWHGVVTRLWTGEKDLTEYQKKYGIRYPAAIDTNNYYFYKYKVSNFNTLLIVKNNQVLTKLNGADKLDLLREKIKSVL
jgi:thiol-disulfide isomerase/thioredoxin